MLTKQQAPVPSQTPSGSPAELAGGPLLSRRVLTLLAISGTSNLAFWLLWPASIVRLEQSGLGPLLAGLLGASTPLAVLLALLALPGLLRAWRPRRVIAVGLGLVAAGAGVMLTGTTLVLTVAASILIGLGTGLRWVALDSWVVVEVPPERRGRALSTNEVVMGLTFAGGPALAALLGPVPAGLLALALPLAAAAIVLGTRDAAEHSPDSDEVPSGSKGWRCSALLIVLPAALLGGLHESGFAAVAPLLALDGGQGSAAALTVAAAVGAGSFMAQFALGGLADRLGGLQVLRLCAVITTAAFAVLAVAPSTLLVVSVLVGGFGGGLYTVAVVYGLQAAPRGDAGALIGRAAIGYVLGALIAPPVVGWALDAVGAQVGAAGLAATTTALLAWLIASRRLGGPQSAGCVRPAPTLAAGA